ncbi:tRNA lysidine(34) synthetase TilS [Nocardioides alkalitolerans]|uniref:tRNA lysidine(34) synthetase TilS n=1 Tax=Nocardioides alkalitolerans TaxID=281714 RepID=UPI0004048A3D|nr:tRNA lysidine(34) synthetase TilS [Nocardioides alkalitolerans]
MTLDPAVAAVRNAVRPVLAPTGRDGSAGAAGPAVVAVACSGGADSLALLAATVFVAHRARDATGTRVVGVTVDHGLQDGSDEHAARVVEQMAALGVDETVAARVRVEADGHGVEAAAREARYAVLGQVATHFSAERVLLGHTLDDQAETVLLGLARGSGGRSIAGMRRAFDPFARPLLDVSRAQTEAACSAEGIAWWTDPHNADPRFLRSRVRHAVLPVLEAELNPQVRRTLARTADQLQADLAALDHYADALELAAVTGEGLGVAVDAAALAAEPGAVADRVLRRAAVRAGALDADLFATHVQALRHLMEAAPHGEAQLPGHLTSYVTGAPAGRRLRFRRTDPV